MCFGYDMYMLLIIKKKFLKTLLQTEQIYRSKMSPIPFLQKMLPDPLSYSSFFVSIFLANNVWPGLHINWNPIYSVIFQAHMFLKHLQSNLLQAVLTFSSSFISQLPLTLIREQSLGLASANGVQKYVLVIRPNNHERSAGYFQVSLHKLISRRSRMRLFGPSGSCHSIMADLHYRIFGKYQL